MLFLQFLQRIKLILLIFAIFTSFLYFLFFIKEDLFSSFDNKIFVLAEKNNESSDNQKENITATVTEQLNEVNSFLDRWPFNKLKVKIEKLIDSIFTEELLYYLLLIFFIFICSFFFLLSRSFGLIILSSFVYSFYWLQKLWERTEAGSVFLNLFDKIILIKPIPMDEKILHFNYFLEKYKILTDAIIEQDKIKILSSDMFQNINKEDFLKKLEDYITSNFANLIKKVESIEASTQSVSNNNLDFLFFTDIGKDLIKSSFTICQQCWDYRIIIFYITALYFLSGYMLTFLERVTPLVSWCFNFTTQEQNAQAIRHLAQSQDAISTNFSQTISLTQNSVNRLAADLTTLKFNHENLRDNFDSLCSLSRNHEARLNEVEELLRRLAVFYFMQEQIIDQAPNLPISSEVGGSINNLFRNSVD
jgi:hypothetical protein